jgi:anti-sigma factor RsiW
MSWNFQVVSTCSSGNGGLPDKGLARQVQHDRAVLADGIQHHRLVGLCDDLAHDVDALGLQPLQVVEWKSRRIGPALPPPFRGLPCDLRPTLSVRLALT